MERIRGTMKALIAPVPRWREAQTASTRIQRQLHGGSGFTRVLQRYRRDTSRLINAALGDGRRAMNAAMRDVHAWLSQEATVMTHYSTRLDTAEDDMVRRVIEPVAVTLCGPYWLWRQDATMLDANARRSTMHAQIEAHKATASAKLAKSELLASKLFGALKVCGGSHRGHLAGAMSPSLLCAARDSNGSTFRRRPSQSSTTTPQNAALKCCVSRWNSCALMYTPTFEF